MEPRSAPLQIRRGERVRRSSDRVPPLPSARESWGSGQLGRYGVIPPLGEEWSSGGVNTGPRRPTERHVADQPNDPLSHQHRHDYHSVLTYPPPTLLPNPLAFHGGAILPGYPQSPLVYPMMSHVPPISLMASPLQYIPSPPLHYHLPPSHLPPSHLPPSHLPPSHLPPSQLPTHFPPSHFVRPPEITELHRSELSPDNRPLLGDYQLRDVVCEEVCSQLVESSLPELVREVIDSCFKDIARSYLSRSQLLLSKPHSERIFSESSGSSQAEEVTTSERRRHLGHTEESEVLAKPPPQLQVESNSELSHHVATMVLDEILFCQLLEALMDGGRELAAHRQAEHILNGLMLETLLQRLY